MKTDKEFEEFFNNRFKDFESDPPGEGWDNISSKIKRKVNGRGPRRAIGALVLFCLTFVAFYFNTEHFKTSPDEQTPTEKLVIKPTDAGDNKDVLSAKELNSQDKNNYYRPEPEILVEQEKNKPSYGKTEDRKTLGEKPSQERKKGFQNLTDPSTGDNAGILRSNDESNSINQDLPKLTAPTKGSAVLNETGETINAEKEIKTANGGNRIVLNPPDTAADPHSAAGSETSQEFSFTNKDDKNHSPEAFNRHPNMNQPPPKQSLARIGIVKGETVSPDSTLVNLEGASVAGSAVKGRQGNELEKISSKDIAGSDQKHGLKVVVAGGGRGTESQTTEMHVAENELLTIQPFSYQLQEVSQSLILPPIYRAGIKMPELKNEVSTNKKESDKSRRQQKKYKLEVFISPRLTYRRISFNNTDQVYVESIDKNSGRIGSRLGFEGGFLLRRQVLPRLAVNAGMSILSLKETLSFKSSEGKIKEINYYAGSKEEVIADPVYEVNNVIYKSSYYYSGLTLSSSYTVLDDNRRSLYFTFGGGVNLLIQGRTEVKLDDISRETLYFPSKENPLEQINFKLSMGPGYAFHLGSNKFVTFEPTLNYYLGSTFKKREPIGIRPYTLGLNVGLRF